MGTRLVDAMTARGERVSTICPRCESEQPNVPYGNDTCSGFQQRPNTEATQDNATIIRITDMTNQQQQLPIFPIRNEAIEMHQDNPQQTFTRTTQLDPSTDVQVDDLHHLLISNNSNEAANISNGSLTTNRRLGNYAVRPTNRLPPNTASARSTLICSLALSPPPCSAEAQSDEVLICTPAVKDTSAMDGQSENISDLVTSTSTSTVTLESKCTGTEGAQDPVDLGPNVMDGVINGDVNIPVETVGEITVPATEDMPINHEEVGPMQSADANGSDATAMSLTDALMRGENRDSDAANPARRLRKSKMPTKVNKGYATRSRGNNQDNNGSGNAAT